MKTNILRPVAVALGLTACGVAQAQSPYQTPARWNNFYPVGSGPVALVAQGEATPIPEPIDQLQAEDIPTGIPSTNAYAQAMSQPWEGSCQSGGCQSGACADSRLPLAPYFASSNLLFLTLEESSNHPFVSGLNNFDSSAVDPEDTTGFDVSVGRYLDGGRYGLGMTYMLWNPSSEQQIRTGGAGTIISAMPGHNAISIDAGTGVATVYGIVDGTDVNYAGATAARLTRDVRFQSIEANLYSFGLMGARRVSFLDGCSNGWSDRLGLNNLCGLNGCNGYGGAAGPLQRACNGRVRVMTSHGFRWFQASDDLELAYNIDGAGGYQATDLYEDVDVENNLYGYQFGSRLTYCLSKRMNLNIGGKFGIYGNDVSMRHRIGTQTAAAYRTGTPTDLIDTESSDTVLATLGELDLGLGYRVNSAWSVRGGYRLMGLTGVATAWDSLPRTYATVASSGQVHANDSYLLHGGYVGLEYNW